MNPRFSKTLIVSSIVIAITSLTVNIFLFLALHHARQQTEMWKTAHKRTVSEQLLLKQQLKDHLTSTLHKSQALNPAPPVMQRNGLATSPHIARPSQKELLEKLPESSEKHRTAYQQEVGDLLAEALAADFPELDLEHAEMQELTEAVIRFREFTEELRLIPRTSDNAETINNLMEQRDQAMLDFERISGMSVIEFMWRAPAEGGIDRE